jgi:molybdopterin molybdotransferase
MRKLELIPPAEAMARLRSALRHVVLPGEAIPTAQGRDRVLAEDVRAPIPMPEFRRSTVDGYAVRAADTPGTLRVVGEVRMGELAANALGPGEAMAVPTGGNLPPGADAVVMAEDALPGDSANRITITKQLAPGENAIQEGEDVKAGEVVVRAGARLREQEIGGLLALGITQISVRRKPRVALIASGDELVPAEHPTKPGQVRNINQPMLAALVARNGGVPLDFGILPDRREAFEEAAQRAMREADVIVFTAGSSVGERDFVPEVISGLGQPGVLAHGILFRPGKPTLFAVCDGKPVFGLPGNPISTLITGTLFLASALWLIQGAHTPPQARLVRARLAQDVRSPRDLEHWFPVKLRLDDWHSADLALIHEAYPISTKSNLIFGLARADGMACAPIGVDHLPAGAEVVVRLFD